MRAADELVDLARAALLAPSQANREELGRFLAGLDGKALARALVDVCGLAQAAGRLDAVLALVTGHAARLGHAGASHMTASVGVGRTARGRPQHPSLLEPGLDWSEAL